MPRIAILGGPGTGKSHFVRQEAARRRLKLTASTHLAASNLGPDASTIQGMLWQFQRSPKQVRAQLRDRCLVVDEFTMLDRSELERVVALAGDDLILTGDFEQLCSFREPVTEQWLTDNGFEVRRLDVIHRCQDPALRALYNGARARDVADVVALLRDAGVPTVSVGAVPMPAPWTRAHFISSRNVCVDAMNRRYCEALAVAAGDVSRRVQHWGGVTHPLQAPAPVGALVIAVETTPAFRNQEVGHLAQLQGEIAWVVPTRAGAAAKPSRRRREASSEDAAEPPEGLHPGAVPVPLSALNPGFAVTYHRCQGQTFDFPIWADLNQLFERAMLYVALTRATELRWFTMVADAAVG